MADIPDPHKQPILHSPWDEPTSHYSSKSGEFSYTEGRRPSAPSEAHLDGTATRISQTDAPYSTINKIRNYTDSWRSKGYVGTPAKALLIRWRDCAENREGEQQPYFCQREVIETVMWLLRSRGIRL